MMQNKQSLLLTSDWAHKSLKRLSLSSIPISKQARQLVTILEQLWLNSTQNKQLQQWHRWCTQIRGVRREIERPEGEERKNQKEHGDDGAAWGKRKARQSKPSRRRCICRLCQEHTASTDTIIAVDIHAHAKRNRGCSSITCATEEEELPPPPGGRCSSTPTMLLRVFSTSLRPILQTLLPLLLLLLLLILPRRPAPPKTWNRKTSHSRAKSQMLKAAADAQILPFHVLSSGCRCLSRIPFPLEASFFLLNLSRFFFFFFSCIV